MCVIVQSLTQREQSNPVPNDRRESEVQAWDWGMAPDTYKTDRTLSPVLLTYMEEEDLRDGSSAFRVGPSEDTHFLHFLFHL